MLAGKMKTFGKGCMMQTDEVIQNMIELCRKYSVNKAVLFGSRAKGTALERSDFDIAVFGAADFLLMQEEAWNLPTLFKIDLVNMDTCRNTLLIEDIKKYGKKIYEKVPVVQEVPDSSFGSQGAGSE